MTGREARPEDLRNAAERLEDQAAQMLATSSYLRNVAAKLEAEAAELEGEGHGE